MQIAIAALKEANHWEDGDEIIVPALTFIATSNTIIQNNLKPVFVDVENGSFNIDPKKIEDKVTNKTRAILPVHLLGLPADMTPIMQIAKRHGFKVIEDSCETMFARYKGKSVGSFGDIGCFSTYVAHYIVTGVGGLNVTNNPKLATIMRSLANHGRDSIYITIDDDNTKSKKKLKEIVKKRFNFIRLGYSYRNTELEAGLGLSQLNRYQSIVRKRKENAKRYLTGLSSLHEHLQFQEAPKDSDNVYMLFGVVCREKGVKTKLIDYLEQHNIETRDLLPLLNQPVYKERFGNIEKNYPVAKRLRENGFYIGCHQYLSNNDIDYVINAFKRFFRK